MASDLADVVESFSADYSVARSALATYDVHGDPVAGASSSFSIRACVQPVSGRDLQRVPEGWRTQELITLFTPTELRTKTGMNEPDVVTVNGVAYQVQQVERWAELGNYWRVLAMKVGTT